jgi:electron transport complex protein RnfG
MERVSSIKLTKRLFIIIAVASAVLVTVCSAHANVFLAKDEALTLAFPVGIEVVERSVVLTAAQQAKIEELAQTKISSSLFHFYEGRVNGEVAGYAVIDARIMRSNQAVFMVVLSKDLVVQKVVMLAFNEPMEYMPADAWYAHLEGNKTYSDLVPGQGLPAIAGSTLSVNGVSDGVRAVKASFDVVKGGQG